MPRLHQLICDNDLCKHTIEISRGEEIPNSWARVRISISEKEHITTDLAKVFKVAEAGARRAYLLVCSWSCIDDIRRWVDLIQVGRGMYRFQHPVGLAIEVCDLNKLVSDRKAEEDKKVQEMKIDERSLDDGPELNPDLAEDR